MPRSPSSEREDAPDPGLWAAALTALSLGLGLGALTLLTKEADSICYVPPDGQLTLSTSPEPVEIGSATQVFVCARNSVGQPVGKAGARPSAPKGSARPGDVRVQVSSPTGGRFVHEGHETCDTMKLRCSKECSDSKAVPVVDCIEACLDGHAHCMAAALTESGSTGLSVLFDGSTECRTLWFKQDVEGRAELLTQSGIHRDRVSLTIKPSSSDASDASKNEATAPASSAVAPTPPPGADAPPLALPRGANGRGAEAPDGRSRSGRL